MGSLQVINWPNMHLILFILYTECRSVGAVRIQGLSSGTKSTLIIHHNALLNYNYVQSIRRYGSLRGDWFSIYNCSNWVREL